MNFQTIINQLGLALLLGASLWLSGCNSQTSQTHTIEGMLINGVTKEPIKDAEVAFFQDNGKEGLSKDATSAVDVTNIQGAFSLDVRPFKNSKASTILFSAAINSVNQFATGSLSFNYPIVWMELDPADIIAAGDDPYVLNIESKPFGELSIFFETSAVFVAVEDRVTFRITGDDFSYQSTLTSNDDLNKEFTYPVKGDSDVVIEWEAIIVNTQINETDTIFCKSNLETFARYKF